MKLTPIKVRGKRGQKRMPQNYSGERKEKPDMDEQPAKKRSKVHHSKAANGIGAIMSKDVSRLLQLPQEILERVFIASKNLALPLVNRELRRRMSIDSIKYQLIGAAFGPTWDACYGLSSYEMNSYQGWSLDGDRIEGDSAFQSAVLSCSWAKIDMLLTSYDVWIRQNACGRAYFTIPKLSIERLGTAPEPDSLWQQAYSASGDSSNLFRSPEMSMREKNSFDWQVFQHIVAHERINTAVPRACRGQVHAVLCEHLEIHPRAMIPDSLLAGPFESEDGENIATGEEKSRRLFWLVRGGACLQPEQTWEVTRNGFQAILQLMKGSAYEGISHAYSEKRLALALRLFVLFEILGVFGYQWPKYILQTNLGMVTALLAAQPNGSPQQFALAQFAMNLRSRHALDHDAHHGGRWQRVVDMFAAMRATSRARKISLHSCLQRQRAELFLQTQTAVVSQISSPALQKQQLRNEDLAAFTHEPWSDFGMD